MSVRLTGLSSGLDTDSIVSELVSAYSVKKETYEKKKTKLEWKQDTWKSVNSDIYKFYTSQLGTMRFQSSYTGKTTTVSDSTKATITASGSAVDGSQTLAVNKLAKAAALTGGAIDATDTSTTLSSLDSNPRADFSQLYVKNSSGEYKSLGLSSDSTIADVVSALKNYGLTASFDTTNGRFFINAGTTGADADFDIVQYDGSEKITGGNATALTALGLNTDVTYSDTTKNATKVDGQDAEIVLNGATFTSSTNTFSVNGMTITALAVTGSDLTITTSADTDGIYDKIKSFFSNYNTLINGLTAAYNADSSKGYEPLTDDEKDAMSDTEVEKWEQKIKDSLLRRDETVYSIINSFTTSLSKSYYILEGKAATYNSKTGTYSYDGEEIASSAEELKAWAAEKGAKSYSLSSFGISTLGYLVADENEQYAYHIDGDEDDDDTSSNTDKLKTAIASDPDTVQAFFSALITDTYSTINNKMASSNSLHSAMTIYNDKQMDKEMDDIEDQIDKWQEKLEDMEDYWYSKFSAMETALAQLQAQQSSLAALLGG